MFQIFADLSTKILYFMKLYYQLKYQSASLRYSYLLKRVGTVGVEVSKLACTGDPGSSPCPNINISKS